MRCFAMHESVDVAVVGGGPAGLATAVGIRKYMPNMKVKVYEAAPSFKPQGAGVRISVNGSRALKWLNEGVYDSLVSTGVELKGMIVFDENGQKVSEVKPDQILMPTYEVKETLVPWYAIRDELYKALPEGMVEFGKRGTHVQLPENGAADTPLKLTLTLSGSTEKTETVEAKMVIAADGYRSRLQSLVLDGGLGAPTFNNRMVWRARACFEPGQVPEALTRDDVTSLWWFDGGKWGGGRMFLVYKVSATEFVWTATAPMERIEAAGVQATNTQLGALRLSVMEEGVTEAGALARLRRVYHDYPRDVLALVDATDEAIITEHGIYTHAPDTLPTVWSRNKLLVIGDAAHSFPPTGQGLNVALEDAAVLVDVLRNLGLSQQALEVYSQQRNLRVRAVLEMQQGSNFFNSIVPLPFLPAALDSSSIIDPMDLIPADAPTAHPRPAFLPR